ncbi:MAG: GntR family transcriptional regulator [Hyphomicrobiales bacterium]|nr:GntR family transcriptional regulator [Hyphomicrobiales bacterium]
MPKFHRVKVSKISDSIVSQLEDLVLEGVLKPGEKLPPERELAEELDVSRPSLREAIIILEARGLLESRRGGGTFVRGIASPTMVDPLIELMRKRESAKFDVLEMRRILEVAATGFAAQRRTDADLELIERRFKDLEDAYTAAEVDAGREVEADVEFHLALADASHNMALTHVIRSMIGLLRADISFNIDRLRHKEVHHTPLKDQHREIFAAVAAGDADAARTTANRHLDFVEQKLRENIKEYEREARAERRLHHSAG